MLENADVCAQRNRRFVSLQLSLGFFSAGVSVDRGRNGVGKESEKWRGLEDPGVEFWKEG